MWSARAALIYDLEPSDTEDLGATATSSGNTATRSQREQMTHNDKQSVTHFGQTPHANGLTSKVAERQLRCPLRYPPRLVTRIGMDQDHLSLPSCSVGARKDSVGP